MQAKLIIGLIIAILVIVFTIQNQAPVTVSLFFWNIQDVPMSIAIFSALLLGALAAFLIGLRMKIRLNRELNAKNERIAKLEHHIRAANTEKESGHG